MSNNVTVAPGIISNVFRSASADVCARFYAKDMHSGMRSNIEDEIKNMPEKKKSSL